MNKIKLFDTSVHDLSAAQAIEYAECLMQERRAAYIVTLNTEMVLHARKDPTFLTIINNADLRIADSAGIIAAADILGTPVREKIPGIDFFHMLTRSLSRKQGTLYLYGGKPGVAVKAAEKLLEQYPGIRIAGVSDGYTSSDENVAAEIEACSPDLVAVCLGSPKQELWISRYSGKIKAGVLIGLGGTLDVIAGESKLAPQGWRDHGLEWLYRLLHDPKRIGRMIKLPHIIVMAGIGRLENLWKKES